MRHKNHEKSIKLAKRPGQTPRLKPKSKQSSQTQKVIAGVQIATPVFGYKSHISIDRRYGFIRGSKVTSAAAPDGRQLKDVIDQSNTASDVWADTAYRSKKNEAWLKQNMMTSRIHRRKPVGRTMPQAIRQANAKKSSVRARVEHVFAHQKNHFGLFIRTIGLARAEAKLTLANLAYNFNRLIFHEQRRTPT